MKSIEDLQEIRWMVHDRILLWLFLLHDSEIFVVYFLGYSHSYPIGGYNNQNKVE